MYGASVYIAILYHAKSHVSRRRIDENKARRKSIRGNIDLSTGIQSSKNFPPFIDQSY